MATKHILIVVANPAISSTTGWPVGFWASELTHPFQAFTEAGYAVTIASPEGGQVVADGWSDPRDASGYSKDDAVSLAYLQDSAFTARLDDTPALASLDLAAFDAIVVAGGQAPMFNFERATVLHRAFETFHAAGKPSAALCHGTAVLRWVRDASGRPLAEGRRVTGFANAEEEQADQAAGLKVMPWRIEDALRQLGAHYHSGPAWAPNALADGHLITGQQQHSGAATARLVIEALERQA